MSEHGAQPGRERERERERERGPSAEPGPRRPDRRAPREVAESLLAAHGPDLYAYCAAILEPAAAADVLVQVFEYVEQQAADLSELEGSSVRLTLYAVAQNRGTERGRAGGRAPSTEGLDPQQIRTAEAFATLRPVGRTALVLRMVHGLRWSELERVCGVPRARAVMRVCRAWRRMAAAAEPPSPAPSPLEPASSAALHTPEGWSALRADAHRFAALRAGLRRTCARRRPPEDWCDEIWRRLDQRRDAQARRHARRRAEEEQRKQEQARRAEADAQPERSGPRAPADEPPVSSTNVVDAAAGDGSPVTPSRRWRWMAFGVGLVGAGLLARTWWVG